MDTKGKVDVLLSTLRTEGSAAPARRPSSLDAYRHIALTYLTRPALWVIGAVYLAVLLAVTRVSREAAGLMPRDFLMFCVVVGPLMVLAGITAGSQLRHQFASPAVYLTPRYSRSHLIVALAGYGVACLGVAWYFAVWWEVNVLHGLGMATGVFAFAAGWAAGASPAFTVAFWVMLAMLLPLAMNAGNTFRRLSAVGGVLWMLASLLVLWTFFLRLTSQRGEIGRPADLTNPSTRSGFTLPWVARWGDGDGLPRPGWSLWRVGTSPHDPLRLGMMVCVAALAWEWLFQGSDIADAVWAGFIFAPFFFPSMAAAVFVHHRWSRLTQEILRPVTRDKALFLILAGILCDAVLIWLTLAATMVLAMLWLIHLEIGLTKWDRVEAADQFPILFRVVGASGMLSLIATTLILFLAPFRSFLVLAVAAIGVPMLGMIGVQAYFSVRELEPVHALYPLAIAAVMVPLAYLQWRRAEL